MPSSRGSSAPTSARCPAVGIVLEAVLALALADAALERFGGATVDDLVAAVAAYQRRIRER